ncbi:MAG: hypothetical protein R2827_12185 [Bdellovibrionales bacterium]
MKLSSPFKIAVVAILVVGFFLVDRIELALKDAKIHNLKLTQEITLYLKKRQILCPACENRK